MIDIYLLEQLSAVYDCGTFSAASEKLHLTQPSLTRSMQKLEDILGVKLFDRTKNRAILNENGRLAAECAKHILREEADMIARVRALDRSARTIAIGMISPGPMLELSSLLSSLYPEFTIATEMRSEEELLQGLRHGLYQMIIINREIEDETIVGHPCGMEKLYFVVPTDHRIANLNYCTFREMDGESFLMVSDVGYWERIVREQMPHSRFLLQNSLEALAELIHASSMPHFATDLTIRLYGRGEDRCCIPISDEAAIQRYTCYCLAAKEKKYLGWFQALQRRYMRK